MKNVKVLDCTLRDGGRIIDCNFPDNEIRDISFRLADAKIDIIEVGFLRDWRKVKYCGNSTFFTSVKQMESFVDRHIKSVTYVAFIDYGMFDINSLDEYDGKSIDGIRFGFTKKDFMESYDDIILWMTIIKKKGYKLFVQGVNSLNYSDKEILDLVDMINEIQPYSFGIVDTYGAMYLDDVGRIYKLIDHNMISSICIDFHSHNNYQLSFALAQEVIEMSQGSRNIIIDATLSGMGKVAGNLNTELIVDYLVRKMHYNYDFDDILDIIDDYIYNYYKKHTWGYSVSAMMAGIYKSHPNNILYLTEKFRLDTKDIRNLLSMIPPQKRQRYDYDSIEKLYIEYISDKVDDSKIISDLKLEIENRKVLVLVPGASLNTYKKRVDQYILDNNPVIISVNFLSSYVDSFAFFGNAKRYNRMHEKRKGKKIIVSSNIKSDEDDLVVNYHSLINRNYEYFENSTIMLLNLLKRITPIKIVIAGFDGFKNDLEMNYIDNTFQNDRHVLEFKKMNEEIQEMLTDIVKTLSDKCDIELITPSLFETRIVNNN